jgi:hypothetical protein
MDDCFSKEEIVYLYKKDYEFFKKAEQIVEEKDYQKIWKVKKEMYPAGEKEKLKALEDYF